MTDTTRPTTTAGQLYVGQHFFRRVVANLVEDVVCRVEHVLHFVTQVDEVPMVALTVTPISGGLPLLLNWSASTEIRLATDDDLRKFTDAGRRSRVAEELRRLAADIEVKALPLPLYRVNFGGVLGSLDDLQAWAKHLGGEVRMGDHDATFIPSLDVEVPLAKHLVLDVHFQSPKIAPPAPAVDEPEPDAVVLNVAAGVERARAVQAECDQMAARAQAGE